MYIVVDERHNEHSGYAANFEREGVSSLGLFSDEFHDWLNVASQGDISAVQGFVLGEFAQRKKFATSIRRYSRAPIFALSEERSLDETLELLTADFDDVVRKTIHVREILARAQVAWRRMDHSVKKADQPVERLKLYYDGRDIEIDGVAVDFPRRERQILEYLARHKGKRLSKAQIFNAVYGIYNDGADDSVVEVHVSKLRKKLRQYLGYDLIDAKRYTGYCFLGQGEQISYN